MFVDFFLQLKQAKIPVTIREYLSLLEALDHQVVWGSVEDFYYLARLCLVKDETNFDKFDRVFAQYFEGVTELGEEIKAHIPEGKSPDRSSRRFRKTDGDIEKETGRTEGTPSRRQ
jgi:uncharacterized protein with von Willebrand factor type A (vWA) domain